jgi:hemerythrin
MAFLNWTSELEIGEETIDTQHKWLVDTYNTLMSNYRTDCATEWLVTSLNHLVDYTVTHFDYEEAFQQKYGVPGRKEHKELHENFKKVAVKLVEKAKTEGPTKEIALELNAAIGAWLVRHVKTEDSKMAPYVRK